MIIESQENIFRLNSAAFDVLSGVERQNSD